MSKRLRAFALFAAVAALAPLQAEAAFASASAPEPPPPPPPPPPGSSPDNPVLPTAWSSASTATNPPLPAYFYFVAPVSGLWFDPVPMDGYVIRMNGSFLSAQAAPGFEHLKIRVNGVIVDNDLNSNEVFSFASGVSQFEILGINPTIDGTGANLLTAFPLKLSFAGSPSWMDWTGINAVAVPETGTFTMGLLGIVGVGLMMGRRRRSER